jgi:hypothetical protein
MATKEELQRQLATIEAGLLDFTTVGEASFLKQTGQSKLTTQELPSYSDVYNKEFEAIKDIQFSIGEDASTTATTDRSFYVFDPTRIAKQKTEQAIETVKQANLAAAKQQEDIKQFLASEKESAKSAVLQTYLSGILNPTLARGERNPFEWDEVDLNTASGLARWKKSRNRETLRPSFSTIGNKRVRTGPTYLVKLTAEESAAKRKLTESIEKTRFMESTELQKTYAEKYRAQLKEQLKKMK